MPAFVLGGNIIDENHPLPVGVQGELAIGTAELAAIQAATEGLQDDLHVYLGLSTDSKPTDGVPEGAAFLETDTDAVYRFLSSAWVLSGAGLRVLLTATIADDGNLSGAVDLSGYRVAAIDLPSTWDTAAMTFQVCNTLAGTYQNLYDDTGAEVTIASASVVASRSIVPGTALALQLMAHRFLKLRSGTAGSPVNQTTGTTRVITLVCLPL